MTTGNEASGRTFQLKKYIYIYSLAFVWTSVGTEFGEDASAQLEVQIVASWLVIFFVRRGYSFCGASGSRVADGRFERERGVNFF